MTGIKSTQMTITRLGHNSAIAVLCQ